MPTPPTPRPRSTWPRAATGSRSRSTAFAISRSRLFPIGWRPFSIASSAKTSSPPTCPIPSPFWESHGWPGYGPAAPGDRAPDSMPPWASSPRSGRSCLPASPFPKHCFRSFCCLRSTALSPALKAERPIRFYGMWAALALALLTKGLIAPLFFVAAAVPLLLLSGLWRRWRDLKPLTGLLLFLAIAAPWHILAGLANPDQGHPVGNHPTPGNVHGFWYFYFLNEHVFRFLGTRFPHDYNRMPVVWYWLAHLVWLFPWSLFLPAVIVVAWRTRHSWLQHLHRDAGQTVDFYLDHAGARGRSQLRPAAEIPRPVRLAPGPLLRVHPVVLLHLDQPGVLHLPRLADDPDPHRRGALWDRRESRPRLERRSRPNQGENRLAHCGASRIRHRRRAGRGGSWLVFVGIAQPALRRRHRHPAGAPRCGRLHALHVPLLRPHRAVVCRLAPAGGAWPPLPC